MLVDKGRAEATTRKRCGDARSIFAHAIKGKQIEHNPFLAVPVAAIATKHHHFLGPDDARKVLAELPNAQWRLLFVLARWGGLRVPSEPRGLVWSDVLWDKHRLRVDGKTGERWVPIFPELAGPLREAFEAAEPGQVRVLPFMATAYNGGAVRHPLERAIKRAGLTLWPRLWHNLRSTRQTELEEQFPSHVVCRWLGNSTQVARTHYLQTTDDHFTRAAALPEALPAAAPSSGNQSQRVARATRND